MRRLPLLTTPAGAFASGILRSGGPADAAWIAAVLLAAWILSRRGFSARIPLLRALTVSAAFFCAGSWISGPARYSALTVASLLPGDGSRTSTVCLLPAATDRSRPVDARCRLGDAWIGMRLRILSQRELPTGEGWVTGSLQRPGGQRNPGEPDRWAQSLRTGVGAWLVIGDRDTVDLAVMRGSAVAEAVRSRLGILYGDDDAGALVTAMLTGTRENMPDSVLEDFRSTGIAHVLAVSGLHVSLVLLLVAVPASFAAAWLPLRYAARSLVEIACSLVLLWLVIQVTGPRPSVIRAALLGSLVAGSRLFDRSGSGARSALLLSVLLQLAYDPAVLHDPGFLLSHAAVAGLLSARRSRGWSAAWIASTAATWATAPLVALMFGSIPLAAVFTNLFALPLTSIIVVSGVLSILPTPWSPEFAEAAILAAKSLLALADRSADALGFLVLRADPGLVAALIVLPILVGFRGRSLGAATLLPAVAAVVAAALPVPAPFRYVALETGQGDAQVLLASTGTPYIVDTGPPTSRALERWLDRTGSSHIGAAFLTHLHADHAGRWKAISDRMRVDSLFLPVGADLPDSLDAEVGIRYLAAGDVVRLDDGTVVHVLAPEPNLGAEDANATSLVLYVLHGRTSLLLAGDAERPSEESMVTRWDSLLQSDIVKVGHHGSRTSSTPSFVSRVGARHAVVSVGRNGYGLPNTEVIERWEATGAEVHLTRRDGAFCLASYGSRFETGC